jgi:hypothetical protein
LNSLSTIWSSSIFSFVNYEWTFICYGFTYLPSDAPPSSLMDSTASPKMKTTEGEKVRACSLVCNTLGVKGCAGALGCGLGRLTSKSITHTDLHKLNNKLVNVQLEHLLCTDEPRANTDSHDSPRPGLGEATTFPLIVYFVFGHEASTQMSFCWSLEIPKIRTSVILGAHNFVCKLSIEVRFEAKL